MTNGLEEQERGPASPQNTIANFRDFESGGDWNIDPFQLPNSLKLLQKPSKILIFQEISPILKIVRQV
jgi:hypothetical protein